MGRLQQAITEPWARVLGAALCLAPLLLAAPAFAQPLIDPFTDPAPPITDPPPGPGAFSATPGAGILGGERDAEVRLLAGPGPVVSATAVGGPLAFVLVTPPSSRAVLELQWDGADASPVLDPTGLPSVDLTASGSNTLHLAFGPVIGIGEVVVEVFTDATLASRAAATVAGPGDLFFPFSAFLPSGSSGPADFTAVGAIVVQLFASSDASLDLLLFDAIGPTVAATNVAAEAIGDADGLADPGETLEYTIDISSGGGVAGGVELFDDPTTDPNLSAATMVDATPLARDDLLLALGNAGLSVAAPGLLANDVDPDGGAVTLDTVASAGVSLQGGSVAYAAGDGSFTYTPPVGFRGVDSFTYEIDDDEGNSAVGVVSLLIEDLVWFVNNAPAGDPDGDVGCAPPPCGAGTLSAPFGDFSSLNGVGSNVDSPGDIIFVFEGTGAYDTGDAAGLPLEPGQTLLGEGVDLTVAGVTIVSGGLTERPTLTNTAGVGGDAITLAAGNTIRGLDLGDVPAASSRLTDGGLGVGTLTIGDLSAASTGGVIDVTGGGTLAAVFDTIVSTGASGTPAINLAGVGGMLSVSNPGAGLDTTISGADAGIAIAGSAGSASFSFGETSVITTAPTGPGDGVALTSNGSATIAFDSLDVTAAAGDALVTDSATVTIGGVANTLAATGGAGLDASGTAVGPGGWIFDGVSSLGSPGGGVVLGDLSGVAAGPEVTVSGTTTIASPAGNGLTIASSTAGFLFGTVDIDAPGGNGIDLDLNSGTLEIGTTLIDDTGGSAAIEASGSLPGYSPDFGATTIGDSAVGGNTAAGIDLLSSNAATAKFTFDSLDVTTDGGFGLRAHSTGIVNINSLGAAIDATGGPAVDILSTGGQTNGLSGWTFATLTSDASTSEGIKLDDVSDAFTVSGATTIDGAFDNGIEVINSSGNVSFASTAISDTGTDAGGTFEAHDAGIWLENNTGSFSTAGGFIDHTGAGDNNFGVYAEDVASVSVSGVSGDRFEIIGGGDNGDDVTSIELAQQGPHGVFTLDVGTITLDFVEITDHGDATVDGLEHPVFLVNTTTRIVITNSVFEGSQGSVATAFEGDALVRIEQTTGWTNSTPASGAEAFIGVTPLGAAAGNVFGPHYIAGATGAGAHPGMSISVQGETSTDVGIEFDARIENNRFTRLGHDGSGSAIAVVVDDEAGGDDQAGAVSVVIRGNDFYDVESDTIQADALEGGFLSIVVDNNDFDGDSNGATVEAIGGDGLDPLPDDSAVQITATGDSTLTFRQSKVWSTVSNNEFWDYFDTSSTAQPIIVAITGNSPAAPEHTSLVRGNTIHDDDDEEGIKVTARSDGTISVSVIDNTVLCDDPTSCPDPTPEGFFHDEGGSGATTSNLNLCGNTFPEYKIDKGDSIENDDPNIGCDTAAATCSGGTPINDVADATVTTVLTENGNNTATATEVYGGTEAFDLIDQSTIACPDDENGTAQDCTCP